MKRDFKVSIDGDGRVTLGDEALDRLCNESKPPVAGGDGNTNLLGCTNTGSCGGSINHSVCTNAEGACGGSFNGSSCFDRKAVKT